MLLLTGKIEKAYKVRNYFCLHDRRNSRNFFKLGDWREAKTRACFSRFSALNPNYEFPLPPAPRGIAWLSRCANSRERIYFVSKVNNSPSSNMMEFRTLLCLVMLSSCLAANFVMFPMFGRSHYMFVARLGQELAERGHQVCKLGVQYFILPASALAQTIVCILATL